MRLIIKILLNLVVLLNFLTAQVKPFEPPLSFNYLESIANKQINDFNKISYDKINKIFQYNINLSSEDYYYIEIETNEDLTFYLININDNSYIGPYSLIDAINNIIKTDIIKGKDFILEVNNKLNQTYHELVHFSMIVNKIDELDIIQNNIEPFERREEPVILLTGYWPPTNEMIRHFSQDPNLNEIGWQGDNWEDLGYDIISYFPTFNNPECENCGQGNGTLEVDYQDTSNDFWPIANSHQPIAVITFSRGYINSSWELEYNAYNRTNWIGDYSAPTLPTPNPPDEDEESFFLRNSNLPMNDIVENITNLNLGLDPYIDQNGDPGHFVSEFMAYHGTWYRDLNLSEEENCLIAGHIHVGGQIDWETAKIATEETIRTVINYLNQYNYLLGDLNNDETIDILDLVIIMNFILGSIELSYFQSLAADLNSDAIINVQDIIIVINIILNNS